MLLSVVVCPLCCWHLLTESGVARSRYCNGVRSRAPMRGRGSSASWCFDGKLVFDGKFGCQVAQLGAKWHNLGAKWHIWVPSGTFVYIGLLTVNVCQCLSAKWHIGSWVPSGSEWILVVILVNGHICLLWPVDNFFSVNVYNFYI